MHKKNDILVTFHVNEQLKQALTDAAKNEGITRAALLRNLVKGDAKEKGVWPPD